VGKNKLFKFADLANKKNVFERNPVLKGRWQQDFFKNNNDIMIELACGKGDYSIGMAALFPEKNFIGMDIKGNRIWSAATIAEKQNLENIAFIRDQIDKIDEYFEPEEISEIWITFADPFPKKSDHKRRLTSAKFLPLYKKILKYNGIIHLKTDSDILYDYTKEVLAEFPSEIIKDYPDVYAMQKNSELYGIQTYYEKMHLQNNKTIKYLCFKLTN
jgi:tRNA (guanine-N7-)-methyltransferase